MEATGHGCATFSSIRSNRTLARIRVGEKLQGRIINGWLLVTVILGATIALADGLTRTPFAEREASWSGPLEYEPYFGAVLLAALTLPLMFGYARKARISMTEGLFLWFTFCTTAYAKDFSYIRWPGVPLFVTDVVLVVVFLSIFILAKPHFPRSPVAVNLFLFLFFSSGALSAGRGFLEHRDAILVLRDSALVEYSFFILIAYHLFRSWLSVRRLATWFLLGTAVGALNGLGWFIAAPGERRFIYCGVYVLISLAGTVLAISNRLIRRGSGWAFAILLCMGLLLANARSLFVALAILLMLAVLGGKWFWGKICALRLVPALLTAGALIILATSVLLRTEAGRNFAGRSTAELDSAVFHSSQDPDWQFRLAAWKEAWRRFAEYPLAGEGFGVPFTFEIWDNDPRPHNTFLTVLYKMGLIGFLPLLALLAYFFWLGLRAVHVNLEHRHVALLQIVVLAQVSFCLYGLANLVLESPFVASLFWAAIGIGLRMIDKLNYERSLQGLVSSSRGGDDLFRNGLDRRVTT